MAIIREMGVECGGSNVQMAVNPADGEVSPEQRRQPETTPDMELSFQLHASSQL